MKLDISIEEYALLINALNEYMDKKLDEASRAEQMLDILTSSVVTEEPKVKQPVVVTVNTDDKKARKKELTNAWKAKHNAKDPYFNNHERRRWDPDEEYILLHSGEPMEKIARDLGRSMNACYTKKSILMNRK